MSQLARSIISKNLERIRKEKGYTRETLSLMISKDNSYISKVEKCKVNITIDTLEKIAEVLGISIIDILQ